MNRLLTNPASNKLWNVQERRAYPEFKEGSKGVPATVGLTLLR